MNSRYLTRFIGLIVQNIIKLRKYSQTDEDELKEEDRNKIIKEMLNRNPNLWTLLYTFDAIDSSMIPQEILDAKKDVPF